MTTRGVQKWIAMVNSAGEKFMSLCISNGYDTETVKGWISGKSTPSVEDIEKINTLIFQLTGKKPDITDFQSTLGSAEASVPDENKKGTEGTVNKTLDAQTKEKHTPRASEVVKSQKPFMPEPVVEREQKEANKMEQTTQQTVQNTEQFAAHQEPRKATRTSKHRAEANIGAYVDSIQQELIAMQGKLQGKLDVIKALSNGAVVPDRLKEMVELANNVSNDDLKLIISMLKKCQPVK